MKKALVIDGHSIGLWNTTAPAPGIEKLGRIVDVVPCPTCHGDQYVELDPIAVFYDHCDVCPKCKNSVDISRMCPIGQKLLAATERT